MLATAESKNQAVSKLESLIERGRSRAASVIDHVMRHQPTDRLVRGDALQFRAAENLPEILITLPDREQEKVDQTLHRNAVYQMAQTTDMPVKFLDSLQARSGTVGPRAAGPQSANCVQSPLSEEAVSAALTAAGSSRVPLRLVPPHRFPPGRGSLCDGSAGEGSTALRGLRHRYQDSDSGNHARGVRASSGRSRRLRTCRWRTPTSATERCPSAPTCCASGARTWPSPRRRCGRYISVSAWTNR